MVLARLRAAVPTAVATVAGRTTDNVVIRTDGPTMGCGRTGGPPQLRSKLQGRKKAR